MRDIVRGKNVYRWAGQMLVDAAQLRKRTRIMTMMETPEPIRSRKRPARLHRE
jgi:trehalose 6-phosphate synthase